MFLISPPTVLRVVVALASMLTCSARAQSTPSDAPDVVRVTGVRAIPWKSYRAMRAAMDAYAKYKGHAPDAEFNFGLILPDGYKLPPNFAMRVRTPEGLEYPIVMKDKFFIPPIIPDEALNADVVTNLKGVTVRIGTRVDTPGVPAGMDRLGDMRLACQVGRAIRRVEDDPVTRLLRPNICENRTTNYWMTPSRPADGAELVDGERRIMLDARKEGAGMWFRIPLHDTRWNDNAIVLYHYKVPYQGKSARLSFDTQD